MAYGVDNFLILSSMISFAFQTRDIAKRRRIKPIG